MTGEVVTGYHVLKLLSTEKYKDLRNLLLKKISSEFTTPESSIFPAIVLHGLLMNTSKRNI